MPLVPVILCVSAPLYETALGDTRRASSRRSCCRLSTSWPSTPPSLQDLQDLQDRATSEPHRESGTARRWRQLDLIQANALLLLFIRLNPPLSVALFVLPS